MEKKRQREEAKLQEFTFLKRAECDRAGYFPGILTSSPLLRYDKTRRTCQGRGWGLMQPRGIWRACLATTTRKLSRGDKIDVSL